MPRRARYRTGLLEEFERQLTFAPPDALRRQMDAAEELVHSIDDGQTYPFEFVVWRLTGFRPEASTPLPIEGPVLRRELVTFVLHCSERVAIPADDREGGAVPLAELAVELGVVEKTVRRWRDRGLMCHRVRFSDGRSRVAVFRSEVARFARLHPDLIEGAAAFSRIDPETARRAAGRVRSLVAEGMTENLAAKRVAGEIDRAHETVRQLVVRMGGGPKRRLRGGDRGAREREVAYRAWRLGVPLERIVERQEAKPDAVRRRIDMARAERLRLARITWVDFTTFERADAAATILGAPAVASGLSVRFESSEAVALVETLAADRTPTAAVSTEEDLMLAAYNLLKREAKRAIDRLGRHPDRADLDRVETWLRWALRIKRVLLERWMAVAVARVQQGLTGGLLRRPSDDIRRWLEACRAVVSEVIETADPSRRQSPRRMIAHDTDRLVARLGADATATASSGGATQRRDRAAVRHERGSVPMPGFFERLTRWEDVVDFPRVRRTGQRGSAMLDRRYGWRGQRPRTLEELAAEARTTVARVARLVADEEREKK